MLYSIEGDGNVQSSISNTILALIKFYDCRVKVPTFYACLQFVIVRR